MKRTKWKDLPGGLNPRAWESGIGPPAPGRSPLTTSNRGSSQEERALQNASFPKPREKKQVQIAPHDRHNMFLLQTINHHESIIQTVE